MKDPRLPRRPAVSSQDLADYLAEIVQHTPGSGLMIHLVARSGPGREALLARPVERLGGGVLISHHADLRDPTAAPALAARWAARSLPGARRPRLNAKPGSGSFVGPDPGFICGCPARPG